MGWFAEESTSVTNVVGTDKYYFITDKTKEICKLVGLDSITVIDDSIRSLPDVGVQTLAVPREYIDGFSPANDIVVRTRIGIHMMSDVKLGSILTDGNLKSSRQITDALLTAGCPTIDMGERLLIVSKGLVINRVEVEDIYKQLCSKINTLLCSSVCYRGAEIKIEGVKDVNGDELPVTVSLNLSPQVKVKFSDNAVGSFKLHRLNTE